MNVAATNPDMTFWQPRRTLTLAAARRHSRFITVFRALMIAAAALLVIALGYFIFDGPKTETVVTNEEELVRMTNPRYTGTDGDGVPYNLTAEYAVRSRDNVNAVRLINPVLNFFRLEGAESSMIVAKEGLYDSAAQAMELRTDVTVTTDDGYVCETTHARILAAKKTVEGDEPIFCTGDFGQVRGDTYQILDSYSRFIFLGNVKGKIVPEPDNAIKDIQTP